MSPMTYLARVPVDLLPHHPMIARLNEVHFRREEGLLYASAGTPSRRRIDLVTLVDGTVLAWNGWYSMEADCKPLDANNWGRFLRINTENMQHSMGYARMCDGDRFNLYVARELQHNSDSALLDQDQQDRIREASVFGLWAVDVDAELERILDLRGIPRERWARTGT